MPVNLNAFYDTEFDQHEAALDATRKELAEPFARLVGVCTASIRSGNKLVLFGNQIEISVAYLKPFWISACMFGSSDPLVAKDV